MSMMPDCAQFLRIVTAIILVGTCNVASAHSQAGDAANTHVTIYLEPPILEEGGAIIVSGVPVPHEEWRTIPPGENPAANDVENPKTQEVEAQDRHFGAIASSPVTVVEFPYPENGSYTFNFLPAKPYREKFAERLNTEHLLTGSGSKIVDPETTKYIDWPSVDTIAVLGSKRDRGWVRLAKGTFTKAFDDGVVMKHYEGVRTISLTSEQIEKYVVEPR
jgi:hypothetical protein